MRRTRATPTEERELLPLHRPSTSLSLSVGSRPTAPPLSPTSPQLPSLPPPRRRASTATSPPPTPHATAATTTNSGYGYKRRETPHDAALADLNNRLTGGAIQEHASVNPPQSRTGGGAPTQKNTSPSEEEHAYYDSATGHSPTAAAQSTTASSSYHRRAARHLSLPPPPRSSSSAAPPQYEAIYDPYTGQYRGQLVPPPPPHSSYRLHHPHQHQQQQHMSRPQRQPDSPSATSSSASSIKTSSSSSSSSDKEDDFLVGPPPDVNLLLSPEEKKREEDMWATLARIRVIQSEVSKKQLSLEAFAVPSAYPKDNKATTLASSEEGMQGGAGGATTVSPRGSVSRKSGRETVAGGISDDPGSVKTDKRSSKTAPTASPTTANAAAAAAAASATATAQPPPRDAFAQRREAIDEIVKKLDDLSCAVKQLGAHNRPPTSPPVQPAAQPSNQPPTLQIPATTRPAGGFGWRSPSTSSYNSFKEQFNARNKQRQAGQQTPGRVASPPPLQRATTAPVVTVQPPSAISPSSATRAMAYPGPALQNTNATPRILATAAPGGYSSTSSREDYHHLSSARNRQPLLYDSPASTQGDL